MIGIENEKQKILYSLAAFQTLKDALTCEGNNPGAGTGGYMSDST